jgi:mannose-6-phosphate isomerase-like protein (cupin superfamily)
LVASIEEIEGVPGPDTLVWHPVRRHFGIRAFGTNAYTADVAGRDVVEPHTESTDDGYSHEELYFVHSGVATFTIDDETFDAPAGTYVFIPEPEAHRHAIAKEPGTTVLSFGGPPTFKPSAWEWSFAAEPFMQDDPDRAREILEDGREAHPGSPHLAMAFACLHAAQGDRDEAVRELRSAIEQKPRMIEWAREEELLSSLRDDPEFRDLVARESSSGH